MSPRLQRSLWILGTLLLAAGTAFVVARATQPGHSHGRASGDRAQDLHHWMHEQLELQDDQHAALEPIEAEFEASRARLQGAIDEAGRELAAAVRRGDPQSAEIARALQSLNHRQAELQRATLDHFFAMKDHLDPEQADKLLQWTHDSIVHH